MMITKNILGFLEERSVIKEELKVIICKSVKFLLRFLKTRRQESKAEKYMKKEPRVVDYYEKK
jgi:hypothetical protein